MKMLHILRSEPDDTVQKLCSLVSKSGESSVKALYEKEVDWDALVDEIFSHDKIICWW
jgi:hypothetical protein